MVVCITVRKISPACTVHHKDVINIGSTSLLTILHQKIDQVNYTMTEYHFEIAAAADAKKRWETEFKKDMKICKNCIRRNNCHCLSGSYNLYLQVFCCIQILINPFNLLPYVHYVYST